MNKWEINCSDFECSADFAYAKFDHRFRLCFGWTGSREKHGKLGHWQAFFYRNICLQNGRYTGCLLSHIQLSLKVCLHWSLPWMPWMLIVWLLSHLQFSFSFLEKYLQFSLIFFLWKILFFGTHTHIITHINSNVAYHLMKSKLRLIPANGLEIYYSLRIFALVKVNLYKLWLSL